MPHWRFHFQIRRQNGFDGIRAFYLNTILLSMVLALVGVFTPVFIYRQGVDLYGTSASGLVLVALFYIVVRLVIMATAIPISRIIEKIGFRMSVLVSVFFLAFHLIALYFTDNHHAYWLLPAAIFVGINVPLYWISRMSTISIDSKGDKIGQQVGTLMLLEKASYILGPFAGGLIIEIWGFKTLYLVSFLLLSTSVVPVFMMGHHVHRNGVSLKGLWYWVKDRRFFHQAVATVGRANDDYAGGIVWPVVVSLMGSGLAVVGSIFSVLGVVSLIMRYVSGVVFDRLHRRGGREDEAMFGIAAIVNSATWIARMFVGNVSQVLLVDSTMGSFGTVYRNVSDDYTYLGGKRMSEIAYFTYREIVYSVASIAMLGVMIIGVYFGVWKELVFITASFWVLVSTVQARESNMHH